MAKLVVENLKYRYPLAKNLALNNLSFEVKNGEFIGMIGPNHAGKSTLCQALVGLVPQFFRGAYGGRVMVDDMEASKVPLSKLASKIGIVFQNPFSQISGVKLTVYEEVAFSLENNGFSRSEMIDRIDWALKLLNIEHYQDRNPLSLSGGQMQRLAIASIIALKPEIIVLDEPTSQLDPQGSEEVFKAVGNLCTQGLTVIIAEHKMERICKYAQKILFLHQGHLVTFDTPYQVFSHFNLEGYGINAPVFTNACKKLEVKLNNGFYPIKLDEAYRKIGAYYEHR
ncbi:MAG: ABC transporter ATP-binding protein [Firmicutes bacterium]|nr:ABC transporter ATP-binding protein [Bacillota bacterium]